MKPPRSQRAHPAKPRLKFSRFWLAAGLIITLNAALAASLFPLLTQAGQRRAIQLVARAATAPPNEAQLTYTVANLLDPGNPQAATNVAEHLLAEQHPKQAQAVLNRAHPGRAGETALRHSLMLETYLELNNLPGAIQQANHLLAGPTTARQLRLVALAYTVGEREDLLARHSDRLSTSEAARRVLAAWTNKIALAQELSSTGLLRSSQRLLLAQPHSFSRDLLLGQLLERTATPAALRQARSAYTAALNLNPTSREARRGLVRVLQGLHDPSATHQASLLRRLEHGQP